MFSRVLGFLLGLLAPLTMVFGAVLAIPDIRRYRRMKRM
jgi:hypothetical protein